MKTVEYVKDTQGNWIGVPIDDSTGGSEVQLAPPIPETTTSYQSLSEYAGFLRNRVRFISRDVEVLHRDLDQRGLDERASEFKDRRTLELLNGLNEMGFSWRDIARMTGVSVPAVQKWRKGEATSGENHKRLMVLTAVMYKLQNDHMVPDVETWADMPIVTGVPITAIDLISASREDLVLELAADHRTNEAVLDEFSADWRDQYRSDYVVVESSDGIMSIVPSFREAQD